MDAEINKRLGDVISELDKLITRYIDRGFSFNCFPVEVVARERETGDFTSHAFNIAIMSPEATKLWMRVANLGTTQEGLDKLQQFLDANS